ncbi:MAG: ATP-binding cassette domain-containing protein [Spirochaetales bacterium]|nr:ATP-binding cassette domain-containing protein [Spirochaetales bacterium]
MKNGYIVEVKKLSKSFGDNQVLNDVSIGFVDGEISVVIGKSGTGKSVLIKNIIGILKPDAGDILYNGKSIYALDTQEYTQYRQSFGYLFQESALFDSMNVFDNIAFPLVEVKKIKDKRYIERFVNEKLEWVGLPGTGKLYPAELSGGMKKRAALARALAISPQILLFDEPTTGLDPVLSESIDELILRVNNELGLTCIVISHDIPATFRIAHKIALLHDTRIQFHGTPREAVAADVPMLKKFITNSFVSVDEVGD